MTLVLRPDPGLWDGRFANNAWLQECPKPLTKQVWGNALALNPQDAARLGARLPATSSRSPRRAGRSRRRSSSSPASPTASSSLTLGLGRRKAGAIGNGIGANAFALRTTAHAWSIPDVTIAKTGRRAGDPHHPERGPHARTMSASSTRCMISPKRPSRSRHPAQKSRACCRSGPSLMTATPGRW